MKKKIAITSIVLNPPYWSFAYEMLWGLNTFFLKHPSIRDKYKVDYLVWSDIPEKEEDIKNRYAEYAALSGQLKTSVVSGEEMHIITENEGFLRTLSELIHLRKNIRIFPTESIEWPMPTLMRYHLFLQQEEELEKYDYVFYIDVDMRITDWIGEEILSDLTAAEHPMYSLSKNMYPPYEPNSESSAYIKRPGKVVDENGKPRFQPYYYAGGFQGGKATEWVKAMKAMRKSIDEDFSRNYIAIWNDESHWNRYLFDNPPSVVLSPAYIYPDSLIDTYYVRQIWKRNYSPKIMTLTKSFSTTKEGGEAVKQLISL